MTAHRLVAVIPTYDNPATIESVVAAIRDAVGAVIVVDDGSGPEGRAAVDRAGSLAGVTVVHRARNGGKGAAVKTGLAEADAQGFTHALQIDADGQHDVSVVPELLAASRAAPEALVLAAPQFDASAPRARMVGRRITLFWTAFEVGGDVVGDPMCGLRVYPVRAALAARARGDAMDFDPEIAVRMVWNGAPVVHVPTRVRYLGRDEGGVSHFRMFRDNALISWMHTRLVLEKAARALGYRPRAAARIGP